MEPKQDEDWDRYQGYETRTIALIECKSLNNKKEWEDDLLEVSYSGFDDSYVLAGIRPSRFIMRRPSANEIVEFIRWSGLYKDVHIEWEEF